METDFKCSMDEKFSRRCAEQCDSCATWYGQPSGSSNPMEDPPTRSDLETAATVLERTAHANLSEEEAESESCRRVAAFARALAPMMDMLHEAIARGTLPDVSQFIPGS